MVPRLIVVFSILCFLMDIDHARMFQLERDFSQLTAEPAMPDDVRAVVRRLRTFHVAAHPRVRLLYRLLRRGMRRHAHRAATSLYVPHAYRAPGDAAAPQPAVAAPQR